MANCVPGLLDKIARLRPRVVCFIGKGLWLHVEGGLRQRLHQTDSPDGDGIATESVVVVAVKREEEEAEACQPISADAGLVRSVKAEEEEVAVFGVTGIATDSSSLDADHVLPSASAPVRRGSAASLPSLASPKKAAARSEFAYGIQPYRAIHDVKVRERVRARGFILTAQLSRPRPCARRCSARSQARPDV